MLIKIDYGNSASINTGLQYENIKPFYNISTKFEIEDDIGEKEKLLTYKNAFDSLKSFVDPMIRKDMKVWANARYKCSCSPIMTPKGLQHDESCLQGTGKEKL